MDQPILECLSAEQLAADREWWAIYYDSFPSAEREPASVIVKSVRDFVGLAFRTRMAGNTVGIATTHLLAQPAAVFLVYLAIVKKHRSARLGGPLFEYADSCSEARIRAQGRHSLGLIWEVDIPGGSASEEMHVRQKRIEFFERYGGVVLRHAYMQPPVSGAAVPMRLMFRPAPEVPPPSDSTIDALIRAIYFEKYAAVNGIPSQTLTGLLQARV